MFAVTKTSPLSFQSLTPENIEDNVSQTKESLLTFPLNFQPLVQFVNTVPRSKSVMEEYELENDYTMQQQTTFDNRQMQSTADDTSEQK
ncbi:12287_t:CDS:2, partial [Dentiscutata erythropus]